MQICKIVLSDDFQISSCFSFLKRKLNETYSKIIMVFFMNMKKHYVWKYFGYFVDI